MGRASQMEVREKQPVWKTSRDPEENEQMTSCLHRDVKGTDVNLMRFKISPPFSFPLISSELNRKYKNLIG